VPDRELTPRERAVLDFERTWPAGRRGKRRAIEAALDAISARYYQVLADLVGRPEAARYDALLVQRLRRRRRDRLQDRSTWVAHPDQRGQGTTR
jgi:hypothetical protein